MVVVSSSLPMVQAWGGFQNCSTVSDCITPELFPNEIAYNPACAAASILSNAEGYNFTEPKYCVCSIATFRSGRGCLDRTEPFGVIVAILDSLVCALAFYHFAKSLPFFLNKSRKFNAAYQASFQAMLCLVGCMSWAVGNIVIMVSKDGAAIATVRVFIDIIGMVFSTTMGVGSLITISQSWFETFNSMKSSAKNKARKIKIVGRILFGIYIAGMVIVLRIQNYLIAAALVVLYSLSLALVYAYLGRNLRKAFSVGSTSKNTRSSSVSVIKRIKASIKRVVLSSLAVALSVLLSLPAMMSTSSMDLTDSTFTVIIRIILIPSIVLSCVLLSMSILAYTVSKNTIRPTGSIVIGDQTNQTNQTNNTTVETLMSATGASEQQTNPRSSVVKT